MQTADAVQFAKLGIGTTGAPKGGIGSGLVFIEGTDNSATVSPHVQITTSADNYPLMTLYNRQHDRMGIAFDAYIDPALAGGAGDWASSDAGSNFLIFKVVDSLRFSHGAGVAAGSSLAWTLSGAIDTSGKWSFGPTASPAARVQITEPTIGNEVLRLQSTATNDDPNYRAFQARGATTDATVTSIFAHTITDNNTYLFTAHVVARRTGGTGGTTGDSASYIVRGSYKRNGAGPVQVAQGKSFTAEDQAGWDAAFAISGNDVQLQVTGAVNNNVTWHATLFIINLSS
jgi:hypothetical protein